MIWVGSFKSLQSALDKPRFAVPLEVHTWLPSDIGLISPFVDWLISLIAESRCVRGKEEFVELALRASEIKEVDSTRIMFLILWRSKTWMPNTDAAST